MAIQKLDFDELNQVVGGFSEENAGLPTFGMEIVCPACHSRDTDSFASSALYDPKIGSVEYRCACGCRFVCYNNKVILREDWDSLCKQKGITYGF